MKNILLVPLFVGIGFPALAQIGSNAPPIPSTYVSSHPRLGVPASSWLTSLWNGGTLPARYSAAAGTATTGFDTTCMRQNCDGVSFRYLLLSYMASKAAGAPNAVWKNKLITLAGLGGTWGQVELQDNTASINSSGCVTTCSVNDINVNFLTGCGGTCAGEYLTVQGLRFVVETVTDSHDVVIQRFSSGQPYPFPNGTGLNIVLLNTLNDTGETAYYQAMLYDWMYSDFTVQQQSNVQTSLANLCLQFENDFVNYRYSPYNDEFYAGADGWIGKLGIFAAAMAIYPDMGSTGQTHLQWAMDVMFNYMIPAWQQVMMTGGWHEGWTDYIDSNANVTMKAFIVGAMLPWANATNNMPGLFTTTYPWLKNFAYLTMYVAKPDFTLEKLGGVSTATFEGEYETCSTGNQMGALNGLAEIYNDPVLRGWARLVNGECATGPDGFEPSAWPFYTADNKANASTDRSSLPLCHNFTGWGTMICRSGWSEADTWMSFRYGENFWGHMHADAGSFTLYNGGSLAIDSGTYHSGSYSRHNNKYATQAIAHNTLTVTDPADVYPSQLIETVTSTDSSIICEALPNDGGQRRIGSGWQEYFSTSGCGGEVANTLMNSPSTLGQWYQGFAYFHQATPLALAASPNMTAPAYVYMAVDLTTAYNNPAIPVNVSDRTNRVAKFVRHIVFIPRGHAGYFVVYDQIQSTAASFVKKWLFHSINQPTISGNKFTVQRTENATSKPYPSTWPGGFMLPLLANANSTCGIHNGCYQYSGQLTGFAVTLPGYANAPTLATVGGPGHEFDDGTGINQNECQAGIDCADATDTWGLGNTGSGCAAGFICPTSAAGGQEAGAWRIEEQPYGSGAQTQDWFLNVMLASSASDTNIPPSVTAPSGLAAGMVGATWTDTGHTYTITFPQSGVGGTINISGVVNESLLTYAQPMPATLAISSGNSQSGAAGSTLPSMVTLAKDSGGNAVTGAVVNYAVTTGSGFLSLPAAITNSSGLASDSLTLGAGASGSVTTVMAGVNGLAPISFNATISGGSSPVLTGLSCNPVALNPGTVSVCVVTLSQAAGSGGVTLALSSNASALTVPSTISVPSGVASTTFNATAGTFATGQTAVVTATLGGASQTVSLTLALAQLTLNSVSCTPSSLISGGTSTCTVTLSQAAGSGGATVSVSSSAQALSVPASVLVPSGVASTTFTATAGTFATGQTAVVTATLGGASQTVSLTLALGQLTLNSVSCSPSSLISGGTSTCTVTLSQAAGSGGATVSVSSSAQALSVPASVLVPAGSVSAAFTATAGAVSSAQSAAVTATFGGASQSASLSLTTTASGGAINLPTGTWVNPLTNGIPEQLVGYGRLVYAPAVKESVMLENYHGIGSEPDEALVGYNFPANRWDVLSLGGGFHTSTMTDGGHMSGMFTYNANNSTFVYYCCFSGSNESEMPLHTWWFDPIGQVVRDEQPPTKPGLSLEASAAFDPVHGVYVLFNAGATWIYTPSTNSWSSVTPGGTPPTSATSGSYPGMTYDSANKLIYLFGGGGNDIYTYNVASNTWTLIAPATAKPPARNSNTFVYDSTNNVFLAYGGLNVSGAVLNDTWVYNPGANTWTQLSPAQSPPVSTIASFQYLTYDSDDNAFVLAQSGGSGYANGTWGYYGAQTWLFRYAGTGPNPGSAPSSPQPQSGSINNNSSDWASHPVLASNGAALYAGWTETGQPFDSSAAAWPHFYASLLSGGVWQSLGGSFLELDSDVISGTAGANESHAPSLTVIGGTPWASWYKSAGDALSQLPIYAKSWNGSAWVGGAIGPGNKAGDFVSQGRSQIVGVGSTPYIAFLENDRAVCYPWCNLLYVKSWNGSSWASVGSGPLNRSNNYSVVSTLADSVSIATDGTNPYVAWTEYTAPNFVSEGSPQVYVSMWNGSSWVSLGGSLNVSASDWAYDAYITYANGHPYVAWTERTQTGPSQVFVKTWNGSAWTLVGSGTLNTNTSTGWAFTPSLTSSGANLYLGWVEQSSIGQKAETYVDVWNGSSWAPLGGTLNADSVNGSAEAISLTVLNNQPVAAWGEVNFGSLRQVFLKQWNGSSWTSIVSAGVINLSCDLNGDGVVNGLDVQLAINQALGITPCTTADLQQTGQCNVIDVQRVIDASLGGACLIGH